jgi:homoserine kinase type II
MDLPLAGSPERTVWRSAIESDDGRLFVVEKIPTRLLTRKRWITRALNQLYGRGPDRIVPYLPDCTGDPLPLIAHGLWQLSPFVPGVTLERPAYVMDPWRGHAAADFLIWLNRIGTRHPGDYVTAPFSIASYVHNLYATIADRRPEVALRFARFMTHLERHFSPNHDGLPTAFCHGDYHPLNIIWGRRSIRAVIDWEFCGIKTEAYDLANLLGCVGMEDPRGLTGALATRLTQRLRQSGVYGEQSWQALPDLMLAIRFAWLSEWLRKRDRQMIEMEGDYMELLLDYRPHLAVIGLDA